MFNIATIDILIAVAIYLIVWPVVTEIFKGVANIRSFKALLLSWLIGIVIMGFLVMVHLYKVSVMTICLFVIITAIFNGYYNQNAALKKWLKKIIGAE